EPVVPLIEGNRRSSLDKIPSLLRNSRHTDRPARAEIELSSTLPPSPSRIFESLPRKSTNTSECQRCTTTSFSIAALSPCSATGLHWGQLARTYGSRRSSSSRSRHFREKRICASCGRRL